MKVKRLLLIVVGCIFIYSGIHIAQYVYNGYSASKMNVQMQQQYAAVVNQVEAVKDLPAPASSIESQPVQLQNVQIQYEDRFNSLLEVNSDIVGWLSIAGTSVDFPVVQHIDNQFYLNHNIEKKRSSHGAIFMDYRIKDPLEEKHTIIYGHHMKDGSMFGELSNYKDETYFKEHAIITLDTPEQLTKWEVFSVYVYTPENQFFQYQFESEQDYGEYITKIVESSLYSKDIEVTATDQLLTLVTCTYEVNDARFIVHAKRVE